MFFRHIKYGLYLLRKIYWKFRFHFILLITLSFLDGIFGALGIAALVPLFSFIVKGNPESNDVVSRFIFKIFFYLQIEPTLSTLLVFISSLFILKAAILWTLGYLRAKAVNNYLYTIRSNLYEKTLEARWSYLLRHKIGYLENILMGDAAVVVSLLKAIIAFIQKITNLVMYLIIAFSISFFITGLTLTIGGIILFVGKPLVRKGRAYAQKVESVRKNIAHQVNENMIGIKTVKATNTESIISQKGSASFRELKDLGIKTYLLGSITAQPIEPLAIIFIAILFAVSYSFQPDFNIAAFLVIMYLIRNIFIFVENMQGTFHDFNQAIPYVQRLVRFQEEVIKNQESTLGRARFKLLRELEFQNVNFSYHPARPTLKDISFKIKKGEMLGVIGSTGSGKTTLVDLILRLFDPASGRIFLDGRDVAEINLGEWRRHIGYVPQDIFLKNDTIASNIKFYNQDITENEIIEASKEANIYDFIRTLEDGFNTIVGERGVLLSGGQRQRIVLARELARKPKILILDEATNSLDSQSENLIKEAIDKLKKDLIIIAVTHRLPFIMEADKLIAIEHGRIIEAGTPKQLLANNQSYFYKAYYVT